VKDGDVRKALFSIPVPDELAAQRRAWAVVQAAYAEREPVSWPRRHARPILAFAVIAALFAAAISPPGRALVREVREVVGVEKAEEALFSLRGEGRLLVVSRDGPWIVRADGSKRLLGSYQDASWSPTGRFVVASRENELFALEPDGTVRWSLARRDVRQPRWGGNEVDTRIAYVSRYELRVVAGDGTGDRLLVRRVSHQAPAWRPGIPHTLAYVASDGRLVVVRSDTARRLWARRLGRIERLEWSSDGRLLLVQGWRFLRVFSATGRLRYDLRQATPILDSSFAPSGRGIAFVQQGGVWVVDRLGPDGRPRPRFLMRGSFGDVAWSPDGQWILASWRGANQWVFRRVARVGKIQAVDNVAQQFGGFPSLAGWCCP
jgi:hypothetical protein